MAELTLTSIERRLLAYLDQRGGHAHRADIAADLSAADSRIGRRGGKLLGSNGAAPLIVGRWTARLREHGLVRAVYSAGGHYQAHTLTWAGKSALRRAADA